MNNGINKTEKGWQAYTERACGDFQNRNQEYVRGEYDHCNGGEDES